MAVSNGMSCLLSSLISILLFAGMQIYKGPIGASQLGTIFGGFLASIVFVLSLTAINNFEVSFFGKGFQAQLFPEVALSLLAAMFTAGMVHRVCVTTCFIFSLMALYFVNKISTSIYAPPPAVNVGKHK